MNSQSTFSSVKPARDEPPLAEDAVTIPLNALIELMSRHRFAVLTGAGCSTESGIPDYRGRGRPVSGHPIQHQAFLNEQEVQRRYWARATLGWQRFAAAAPNAAHRALAALEDDGRVLGVVTQNVDRLHQRAGSRRVVELHGALAEVICLVCGAREPRSSVHQRLLADNPRWLEGHVEMAADGDAVLAQEAVASFRLVGCLACGGALRPEVVFFGGSVAPAVVAAAWQLVEEADAMLVVGSSLTVFSGYRFARGAIERGLPLVIVNEGPTRADALDVRLRIHARAGHVLPSLVERLRASHPMVGAEVGRAR